MLSTIMNSPEYYFKICKLLNNLMLFNKLYNAKGLHKLIKEIDPKLSIVTIRIALNYARMNGLVYFDCDYDSRIIYWKKL